MTDDVAPVACVNVTGRMRRAWVVVGVGRLVSWLPMPHPLRLLILRAAVSAVRPEWRVGNGRWRSLGSLELTAGEGDGLDLEIVDRA